MNKEKPIYIFSSSKPIFFYIGITAIFLFFLISIMFFIATGRMNFYSFFFHNIKNNIFRMIGAGFHVSLLGFGIFFLIVSIFLSKKQIICYSDHFEITQLLQNTIIIPFDVIKEIDVKMYYRHRDENNFKLYNQKECRVYFLNAIHVFYLSYKVNGYFDDIHYENLNDYLFLNRSNYVSKKSIREAMQLIKKHHFLKIPYLPAEVVEDKVSQI